jgi:hypothetical protein
MGLSRHAEPFSGLRSRRKNEGLWASIVGGVCERARPQLVLFVGGVEPLEELLQALRALKLCGVHGFGRASGVVRGHEGRDGALHRLHERFFIGRGPLRFQRLGKGIVDGSKLRLRPSVHGTSLPSGWGETDCANQIVDAMLEISTGPPPRLPPSG